MLRSRRTGGPAAAGPRFQGPRPANGKTSQGVQRAVARHHHRTQRPAPPAGAGVGKASGSGRVSLPFFLLILICDYNQQTKVQLGVRGCPKAEALPAADQKTENPS